MICENCKPRELKAMRALESLTPSGSEFVNDVERCMAFVRDSQASQMNALVSFKQEADRLHALLEVINKFWGDELQCDTPIYPGAYLTEEDVPIRDVVRRTLGWRKP